MRKVKIITDSCSDLSGALLEKYEIDYAKMNTILDGKATPASLTWEYYTPKELYDTMRGGKRVTTTQVPTEEFKEIFEKYLGMDFDIVYIGCSLKQSGSVNTARVVAGKMLPGYPDAHIYCIDSLNASVGEGMLAITAAELAKEGKDAKEIADAIIAKRNHVNEYCTVHSLDTLRKAGRVTASSAFFGNLLGVKPILISDADGVQTPIKKVKGRLTSLHEIVSLLKESIDPNAKTIYFSHADCSPDEVDAVQSALRTAFPNAAVYTGYIGPIIGASIGPDAVAIFAYGREVTYRVGDTTK